MAARDSRLLSALSVSLAPPVLQRIGYLIRWDESVEYRRPARVCLVEAESQVGGDSPLHEAPSANTDPRTLGMPILRMRKA